MEKFLLAAAILLLIADIAAIFWMRRQLVTYTSQVIKSLEEMISGKEEIVFDEENETLTAKIQLKLRQLYEILRERSRQSQEEKKEIQEIVSDISHQIKTPMANVRMYHQIMMNRELSEEKQKEFLQAADSQVEKLDSLMQSLIKLSRLETGIIEVSPKTERIYPLIQQAVCDIALKAESKGIRIAADCGEDIRAVCDYKWTLEAVFNLLDNAVKYTPEGGRVRIDVSRTDFFVKISVSDTGKGIPPDHLNQVFQRFYREADVHETEGVGIGLFLTQKIVENQKGFVDASSRVGEGSVFSVHLPGEAETVA
ncbi:HAMP domain-containing histidine kinase [Anaerovorax odorimutans]|uniref:histidine kinase n=1 Tax=Anaerovorax odorimutans TaxID=109327 RepID=A0ABT1RJZ4_9FIRM|nr:HAMP domain-containing sensor histidine kinase [Anaerovorax odorimutans]MCQ4635504.1 HAMP domain-containing histidine kinase [Anaerovorax odorimutans]